MKWLIAAIAAASALVAASPGNAGSLLVSSGAVAGDILWLELAPPVGLDRYRYTFIVDGRTVSSAETFVNYINYHYNYEDNPFDPDAQNWSLDYTQDFYSTCFRSSGGSPSDGCSDFGLTGGPLSSLALTGASRFDLRVRNATIAQPVLTPGADYDVLEGPTGVQFFIALGGNSGGEYKLYLSPAPEPATWALMIAGFGATGAMLRRRQAKLEA